MKPKNDGQPRARLLNMQRIVRELAEMEAASERLSLKLRAAKARIRELRSAIHLESLDAGGESAITAGESGTDVAGRIGAP